MKRLITAVLLASALCALADTVVVNWDASPSASITKYRVYYGATANPATSASQWVEVPAATLVATVTNVGIGLVYFQATAFVAGPVESLPSNQVVYTNRSFAPLNLRITSSTNQTAALWIENVPVNNVALVQRSTDMQSWHPYASIRVYDEDAGNDGLFLTSILPENAFFWRVQVNPIGQASALPLPTGQRLQQTQQ